MKTSNQIPIPPLERGRLSPRMKSLIDYFESISVESVERIDQHYALGAYFKDPFNQVNSSEEIKKIFRKMFVQVDEPRFVVQNVIEQGDQAFMTWDFLFKMQRFSKGQVQICRGSSHLQFDSEGKIVFHRDYWDAAEELYEKIPVLGGLMRWLKRQAH